jgi:Jacalin-like lectin domain
MCFRNFPNFIIPLCTETQSHAKVLGWTQKTWDDDWHLRDFPIEHKYWNELTDTERAAATHIGYTRITWDQTGEVVFEDDLSSVRFETLVNKSSLTTSHHISIQLPTHTPAPPATAPTAKPSTTSSTTGEDQKGEQESQETASPAKTTSAAKNNFSVSKYFGGDGGGPFDDRNHKKVKKIRVFSGLLVDAIQLTYEAGDADKHGGNGGKEHSLELSSDEYVTSVVVRHSNFIQCLTFVTNKGNKLVAGGKGRPLLDKKGDETEVKAPSGKRLSGIMGRSGSFLDSIAFRWGPI